MSVTNSLMEKDLEKRRQNVAWKTAAKQAAAEDSLSDSEDSGSWPPGFEKQGVSSKKSTSGNSSSTPGSGSRTRSRSKSSNIVALPGETKKSKKSSKKKSKSSKKIATADLMSMLPKK